MRISAKADYAVRAMLQLTLEHAARPGAVTTCDAVAEAQDIPVKFLRNVILLDLKRAGLISSTRGAEGGYKLAKAPKQISLADVIRAVDGPLATVHGERPQDVQYNGSAEVLQPVWVAVRASLRSVLENVHLDHLATGNLPRQVAKLVEDPGAWDNNC